MSRMWVFLAVSCALVMSGCVTPMPVSPEAMQAAQCMLDILKLDPAFVEGRISFNLHRKETSPVLVFTLITPVGSRLHYVMELETAGDKTGVSIDSDHPTEDLLKKWKPCGLVIFVTAT